ncbi:MAG: MBL fold metallo-hydrolase [Calditrichia bacterium]
MFFRMLFDEHLAQAAYLIGCQKTGEAIVIDPQRDVDRYIDVAAQEKLKITAVTETHIHADFLSGARELAERIGAKVYVSDEGDADWKYLWLNSKSGGGSYEHQLLKHNDTFMIGNIEFKTLHTPGHTPEHISFLVTDKGSGIAEPMGIASGDFVFVGDVGRPDLLETAAGIVGTQEDSAKTLYQSIQEFKHLPDYLQLWPGHGAGSACGKALGAVPQSTVGYEKRFNASVNFTSGEDSFVKAITTGQPAPPLYFGRMKQQNKMGPAILGDLPKPAKTSVSDIIQANKNGAAILDTRAWTSYVEGHLPGALFTPFGKAFSPVSGSYAEEKQDLFLIAEDDQIESLVLDLVRIGLDNVVGYATPAELAASSTATEQITCRPMTDLKNCPTNDPLLVLDVRRPDEYEEGHLAGTLNIAHTRLLDHLDKIPNDREIWVHCRSGVRSSYAVGLLASKGYKAVQLDGGFLAWAKADGIIV